jgi:hypothetical protein
MGQAKKRGSFEQRKAESIEREAKRRAEIAASMPARRRSGSRSSLGLMLAALGTMGGRYGR